VATLDDVKAYLASVGVPTGRYSDALLNQVIATEQAQQAHKCYTVRSDDMKEALSRRVQVNLAKRGLPLGVIEQSSDASGRPFMPTFDPEIRRLEAPHRRIVIG